MTVPDHVTHYHLPDRDPFLNLSDLDGDRVHEVHEVMRELNELRRLGVQRRPFGRTYLEWRLLTEVRLRELFVIAGGKPERTAPHYFVLGDSPWFEGLAAGMRAVRVPLSALAPAKTSFTLVDSFSAMGLGPQFGFPAAAQDHQRRVYLLDELAHVIEQFGLPIGDTAADYTGFEQQTVEAYVEVQLWADQPVQHLLR